MVEKSEVFFRIIFVLGVSLIVFSFFLDWYYYSFYISDEGTMWGYNMFLGWVTTSETENYPNIVNMDLLFIASYLAIVFLTIMVFVYISFDLPGIKKQTQYEKIKSLGIIFPICACFNLVFTVVFFWRLIEAQMYFPFLTLINNFDNSFISYSIGPGCMIHLCSFVLIAPYSCFMVFIPYKFKVAKSDETIDNDYIENYGKKINLDKIVLKEKVKTEKLVDFEEKEHEELNLNQINL